MRGRDASPGPHCPQCGYSLFNLPRPRCPECGFKAGSAGDAVQLRDWRRDMPRGNSGKHLTRGLNAVALLVLLGGAAALLAPALSLRLFLLGALPALLIIVPLTYYQWSAGLGAWEIWLPLGIVWLGIGCFLLSFH